MPEARVKQVVLKIMCPQPQTMMRLLQGHLGLLENRLKVDTKSSQVTVKVERKDDSTLYDTLIGKKGSPSLIEVLAGRWVIVLHADFTDPDQKWTGEALLKLLIEKAQMVADRM